MNVYDSGRLAQLLSAHGYRTTDRCDHADVIVLNTCHIREKAAEKVFSELGRMKQMKARDGGDATFVVAGCVAQAEGAELAARAPFVDIVVGPQSYQRLPELLARRDRRQAAIVATDFPAISKFDDLPANRPEAGAVSAFITVQEGCDKFCSFCVVPYTRGAEYSRPASQVIAEARSCAAAGVREITLLGQNVNCYHGEGADGREWDLGRLIAEVAEIEGIERIRYTTSYPADVNDALIAAHRDVPALMPYIHLPVQSGSDRILRAMNRRHTADAYLRLVDRLRRARPDIALSSDFIVGFPGESDADFAATLRLVEAVGFAQSFSFKYSPRPGTPASVEPQLDDALKAERLARLQTLLNDQQSAFNAACVGREMPVLFERPGRRAGQVVGRSPYLQAVHVQLDATVIGTVQQVRITASGANSLAAEPASPPPVAS
ncbi:MAG: tRNA (N6-isopentenyl adenosine(37)-C2)-methylthiotransferase MiaB [Rhodospirillales bacterium]|nr:tRNA (N6-isopentenyl adenosine(37)-C2)-methylthiotransferase MiaB [Rhodospirillales bacterium]